MTNPKTFRFAYNGQTLELALPPREREDIPSFFAVGLPKAGSTLLEYLLRPMARHVGLAPYSLAGALFKLGIAPQKATLGPDDLFDPVGYAFLGFRSWHPEHALPGWARGRVLFLVRDPRDMVVSQYFSEAYSHRPPGSLADDTEARIFSERRDALRKMALDDYALEMARVVAHHYARTRSAIAPAEPRIWRYEDVIFDKLRWMHEMLDHLGLRLPDRAIARIVDRQDIRPASEDIQQHVRKVTPGDHREKLKPETIARLNEILADMLGEHGYI